MDDERMTAEKGRRDEALKQILDRGRLALVLEAAAALRNELQKRYPDQPVEQAMGMDDLDETPEIQEEDFEEHYFHRDYRPELFHPDNTARIIRLQRHRDGFLAFHDETFYVYHIPTGKYLIQLAGPYQCIAFIRGIAPLSDWNFEDPDKSKIPFDEIQHVVNCVMNPDEDPQLLRELEHKAPQRESRKGAN